MSLLLDPPKPTVADRPDTDGGGGGDTPKPPRTLRPPPASLAPTRDRLAALVAAWAPVLRLHHADAFHPCSGPWFAARSVLRSRDGAVLAPLGKATVAGAVEAAAAAAAADVEDPVGAARGVRLALDVAARHGQPLAELDAAVPLYARAQLAIPADGGRPTLEVAYVALYAHNGPYSPPFGEGLVALGAHDGDLERTTVRLDAETGELLGVWFNSHRPRDGSWAGVGGVELEPASGGRPLAYVARHGHGTYARPGIHARAWGLANDHCSPSGPLWRPGVVVLMTAARGGLHPAPGASTAAAPELGFVECRGCEVLGRSGDASCPAAAAAATPPRGRPPRPPAAARDVRVVPDDDGVGAFPGLWGETAGLPSQGWWGRAECPVSRGILKRLFLEGWPEA